MANGPRGRGSAVTVAARKKKSGGVAEWSWRISGLVLCAFFGLGVMAGLSAARSHRVRALAAVRALLHLRSRPAPIPGARRSDGAVAVVERADGLYLLDSGGELKGPVAAQAAGDLPVLSGPGLAGAPGAQLLSYAAFVVRAEAKLSELVSEMRLDNDRVATLFLDRTHTELIVDPGRGAQELARAGAILRRWRARQELVSALDMTVAGEAVLRLREPVAAALRQLESAVSPRSRGAGKELASR